MKLLVVCQYYHPEPFRVHAICAELAKRGHEVQVVTGMPNYPMGQLYPGYEANRPVDEELDGVKIHRCPIHPRKRGPVHRLWNYISYPAAASRWLRRSKGQYDAVLINQLSPVMMAKPGLRYGKKAGIPTALYCLDLWPESLLAGGVRRGSGVYRLFHRVSKKIYRAADRLLISSYEFRDYLHREFDLDPAKIRYLPQFAEELFQPLPDKTPAGTRRLLFAGNVGAFQSVDTILRAAERTKDLPVVYEILGDGTELEALKKLAHELNLDNVEFLGRHSLEEMPAYYAGADAMLLTLKANPVLSLTLPGKIQSYLAVGKPIIGAADAAAQRVIQEANCGFCGPAEDFQALAENVRRFCALADPAELGRNGRAYSELHFSRKNIMDRLEDTLLELAGGR